MIDEIAAKLFDPRFMGTLLTAVAAAATAFAVAQPFFETDKLEKRMKVVGDEREQIRRRERAKGAQATTRGTLRVEPKAYMKAIVERYQLQRWLATDTAKRKLMQAGYRGQGAETAFLFFRLVVPVVSVIGALFYLFVLEAVDVSYLDAVRSGDRRRLCRHQGPGAVPRQRGQEASDRDPQGLAGRPRSHPDLRRIRHGDRTRLPAGEHRDRDLLGGSGGGAGADDGRDVLPAGPPPSLRESSCCAPGSTP